jgi:endonuclease-3
MKILNEKYKTACCELAFGSGFELLVAARLSARCRDERVNVVTKQLFKRYRALASFANANFFELEKIIRPCGLSNVKAKDIIGAARIVEEKFNGQVPGTIDELLELPGIGRKTANLILAEVFHKPAVICDVHCIKISNRLGICNTKDPLKVEKILRAVLPPEESVGFCHRLVKFGKETCKTRAPRCSGCELADFCVNGKDG